MKFAFDLFLLRLLTAFGFKRTLALCAVLFGSAVSAAEISFNRDIRPILSENCLACHGFDKNKRDSGLRLDIREEALKPGKSGTTAIVPSKPDASEIILRIEDKEDPMPPEKAHKTLTAEQKALLRRWVAEGALYEPHWSYKPIVRPVIPRDAQSERHPIDAFIDKTLVEKGIKPSEMADEATLQRRLSLDLVGLPPSSDLPQNWQEQIQAHLRSPHFGERWAVWWLDAVRYADSVGFHGDQGQVMFPYRDYVIEAFNTNKRFDQFTLEQIAGDLLPAATESQRIAATYNRLNLMSREGGVQAKEYLAKYLADRVRAVGSAWLGTTIGCAECHDHKFDPFTQKDFYALGAYFADVREYAVYSNSLGDAPELIGTTNHHPFPPLQRVRSAYLLKQRQSALNSIRTLSLSEWAKQPLEKRQAWVQEFKTWAARKDDAWHLPPTEFKTLEGQAQPDGALEEMAGGGVIFTPKATETFSVHQRPSAGRVSAVRMEIFPQLRYGGSVVRGKLPSVKLQPTFLLHRAGKTAPEPIKLRAADANLKQPHYFIGHEVQGILEGWKTSVLEKQLPHTSIWLLETPLSLSEGDRLEIQFGPVSWSEQDSTENTNKTPLLSSLRVSLCEYAPVEAREVNPISHLRHIASASAEQGEADLAQTWFFSAPQSPAIVEATKPMLARLLAAADGTVETLATISKESRQIRRLPRGNWQDESGEIVLPETPGFLPHRPDAVGRGQNRIDLALWLTSAENPITSRAIMNRLWKQFFGTGLSNVLDDLGAQGEPPSHPELLDWLAAEFRDSGWDFQHMIRLIVTSKAYQRTATGRSELKDTDPANRLLAHQNARRMDAEFIRDNALATSGLLNLEIGGPSVYPYQPAGLFRDMQYPDREWQNNTDDRQWRRSLYIHWQRTFLHPTLSAFDAPNRDESACTRTQANTPQQALVLLNDPTFVEAARALAQRLLLGKDFLKTDEARLLHAWKQVLHRQISSEESNGLLQLLSSHRQQFQADPASAEKLIKSRLSPFNESLPITELAAWTSICRVLLNLHETITRY
jgi:Protein of unknown function (DUF1553)/Protein of unknown function (DUF1549)/Planctomycete cytochrome C